MNKQQLKESMESWRSWAIILGIAYIICLLLLNFFPMKDTASYEKGFQDGQANCTIQNLTQNNYLLYLQGACGAELQKSFELYGYCNINNMSDCELKKEYIDLAKYKYEECMRK